MFHRAETPTPTIVKPDLDEVRDVKPKALRPYKVVVLDWTTRVMRRPNALPDVY